MKDWNLNLQLTIMSISLLAVQWSVDWRHSDMQSGFMLQVHIRVPRTNGTNMVHYAPSVKMCWHHRSPGHSASVYPLRGPGVQTDGNEVGWWGSGDSVQARLGRVGLIHQPGHILHILLLFPRGVCARGALRVAGCAQCTAVPRNARGTAEAWETVQGESQERVQATPGLELHNPHAHCRSNGVSSGGDSPCRRHRAAHNLQQCHRDLGLFHC